MQQLYIYITHYTCQSEKSKKIISKEIKQTKRKKKKVSEEGKENFFFFFGKIFYQNRAIIIALMNLFITCVYISIFSLIRNRISGLYYISFSQLVMI